MSDSIIKFNLNNDMTVHLTGIGVKLFHEYCDTIDAHDLRLKLQEDFTLTLQAHHIMQIFGEHILLEPLNMNVLLHTTK